MTIVNQNPFKKKMPIVNRKEKLPNSDHRRAATQNKLASTGFFIRKQDTTGLHDEGGGCLVEEGPNASKSD